MVSGTDFYVGGDSTKVNKFTNSRSVVDRTHDMFVDRLPDGLLVTRRPPAYP